MSNQQEMWNEVCDDNFLKRRLSRYPEMEKYKKEKQSWKRFFSRFAFCTFVMREKYQFNYEYGDFEQQFNLLRKYEGEELLFEAAKSGELNIIKYTQKKGINIQAEAERVSRNAIENGHLEIVKWCAANGFDMNIFDGAPSRVAAEHGRLEILKFLESIGARINYHKALMFAHAFGHVEVEEYLKSKTN